MIIDPDCRDGKHTSCVGGPCECYHHELQNKIDELESKNEQQAQSLKDLAKHATKLTQEINMLKEDKELLKIENKGQYDNIQTCLSQIAALEKELDALT